MRHARAGAELHSFQLLVNNVELLSLFSISFVVFLLVLFVFATILCGE